MAPSKIYRALGAVKDHTSIALARVSSSSSNSISSLAVAIVKATRHEEKPPSEKHLKEIINLTCYSRAHFSACVSTLSRRLRKTGNWAVALKTLMVIHRLLSRGDRAYEKETFFFTSRRGERLLDMSNFRDNSGASNSWDFTNFVRTYARYLDRQLEFRIKGHMNLTGRSHLRNAEEQEGAANTYPVCDMITEQIFKRSHRLQELLERFLSCQPAGKAKSNLLVLVALRALVTESFEVYFHMTEIMSTLTDRFMELEVPDCMKVLEIFYRAAKQLNEVESFYSWCKTVGIARPSNYPQVDKITPKKLMVMEEFIREKAAMARARKAKKRGAAEEQPKVHLSDMKVLLPPEEAGKEEEEGKRRKKSANSCNTQLELDLLDLNEDNAVRGEEDGDRLALTLFTEDPSTPPLSWEPFDAGNGISNWETPLVQSASSTLSNRKATITAGSGGGGGGSGGGGRCSFDLSFLDSLYQQGSRVAGGAAFPGGSAGGMAFIGAAPPAFLELPAPPASPAVLSPPTGVRMWVVDQKQQWVEQQLMWQQNVNNGMHVYYGWQQPHLQTLPHGFGDPGCC